MKKSDADEEILFIGPGFTNDEIDEMFTMLYERLLQYTKSIFDLVEQLCPSIEDQIRLALNIAETDGNVLPCLVAKECEKRRSLMKITEEARERYQPISKKPVPIQEIQRMYAQTSVIEKSASEKP